MSLFASASPFWIYIYVWNLFEIHSSQMTSDTLTSV